MMPVLLFTLCLTDNANDILKRFIDAEKTNWAVAKQYAFVEQEDHFSFDKKGTAKKFNAQTFEVIFVEGEPYKKLVAHNDKPLDAKEASREKKRLEQTAEQRRKERRSTLTRKVVNMGTYDDLLTLFGNQLVGEEEVRGRKAWVILSTPKPGRVPADDHEKEVLSFQKKLWIDEEEYQLARSLSTVVGKHIVFMEGSTILFDFEKINGDAWLQTSGLLDGHLQFAKLIKPAVRTEYKYTKFQKFDVRSTITTEPDKR